MTAINWLREWPGKHQYILELLDRILTKVIKFLVNIVMGGAFVGVIVAIIYLIEVVLNGGQ